MTIREEIIKLLDSNLVTTLHMPEYEKLCLSLDLCDKTFANQVSKYQMLGIWFKGAIESLFYKPNHNLLVLEFSRDSESYSSDGTRFLKELGYETSDGFCSYSKDDIYRSLLIHINFEYQKQQKILEEDNFIVLEENVRKLIRPGTDKRLASYCTTTEKWRYPQRKNVFVLSVESINWELYERVDKLKMWQELFNKYRTDI